jgi:hypothetical protein
VNPIFPAGECLRCRRAMDLLRAATIERALGSRRKAEWRLRRALAATTSIVGEG